MTPGWHTVFDALGIVVGLEAEARIARRLGALVEVGGGDSVGATAACTRLISRGVRSLISFGLAGGLHPSLRPGALVVPDVVLSKDGHWPTHPPLAALLGTVSGALYSGGAVLATAEAKEALYVRTGASAVDLESAAVAEAAARHALPFAVLRAVCDPATRSLPRAALVALDEAGKIDGRAMMREIMRRPQDIGALIVLGSDAARARRALIRRVRQILATEA
jgi:adenosylhomocysteine nucleosidase